MAYTTLGYILSCHRAYEVKWDFLNVKVGLEVIGSALNRTAAELLLRKWTVKNKVQFVKEKSKIGKEFVIIHFE